MRTVYLRFPGRRKPARPIACTSREKPCARGCLLALGFRSEVPELDAELAGFVSEIVLNAAAGQDDHTLGHRLQYSIVALEGGSPAVPIPVGLARILRDVAIACPARRDALAAGRRRAVHKAHVRSDERRVGKEWVRTC